MSPSALRLPSALRRAVEAAAEAAYPREACGLLLGRRAAGGGLAVEDWRPAANVHPEPLRHFELDPAAHFAALREARAGGREVVGHFHSHPDGRAVPSARDLEMAWDSGMLWLIISVKDGQTAELTAWTVERGGFRPVPLKSGAGSKKP